VVNSFYHLAGRTSLPFGSYHFSAYTTQIFCRAAIHVERQKTIAQAQRP
jgi:hypothetical protein